MPLMIKLNRNIMKVDLCLDNGHFITVIVINEVDSLVAIEYSEITITKNEHIKKGFLIAT